MLYWLPTFEECFLFFRAKCLLLFWGCREIVSAGPVVGLLMQAEDGEELNGKHLASTAACLQNPNSPV